MNLWTIWTETLDFNNRLTRKQYFVFAIVMLILTAVTQATVTSTIPHLDSAITAAPLVSSLSFIFSFPLFTASIRRLHDAGHRAWWILIPFAGFIFLFFKTADSEKDWSWGLVIRPWFKKFRASYFAKSAAA
jgi:uncharacterized membrane protein YhaH (DUF805 family)